MKQYAGIDVSLEAACICFDDAEGKIGREAAVLSELDALISWFVEQPVVMERVGLEAKPLSQWLYASMIRSGLAVRLLETRHMRAAFKKMLVNTDKKDARGIAQLMRLGWFRPVHCKSIPAEEVRAMLTARKLLQGKLHDMEMSRRGMLRGVELKVGATTPKIYPARIRTLKAWFAAAAVTPLAKFAAGLERDSGASRGAITTPWSTRPVEGQIGRLKMLERTMFGCAGFVLLHQRSLTATKPGIPRHRKCGRITLHSAVISIVSGQFFDTYYGLRS